MNRAGKKIFVVGESRDNLYEISCLLICLLPVYSHHSDILYLTEITATIMAKIIVRCILLVFITEMLCRVGQVFILD